MVGLDLVADLPLVPRTTHHRIRLARRAADQHPPTGGAPHGFVDPPGEILVIGTGSPQLKLPGFLAGPLPRAEPVFRRGFQPLGELGQRKLAAEQLVIQLGDFVRLKLPAGTAGLCRLRVGLGVETPFGGVGGELPEEAPQTQRLPRRRVLLNGEGNPKSGKSPGADASGSGGAE